MKDKLCLKNITLRDYFAGLAMQALVSNTNYFTCKEKSMITEGEIFKRAYSIADGLIKERT